MIHYRINLIDYDKQRALVAILNLGNKVAEIKWIPLGAIKLAQVVDFRMTKQIK